MSTYRTPHRPLEGIKVIELSHLIAGPYCAQLMGEQGAEVIKVEPPTGELSRHREPMHRTEDGVASAYYSSLNRGKKSLALDLKNADGLAVLDQLLASADVFVTNMRASALKRLGLHPEDLRERHPRLIIACISGFGMEDAGDYAGRAGLAMVAEAMTGSTGLTRDHAGNPVWCGFALGDIMAGMNAHSAILLALRNLERHGTGQILDISLVESTLPLVTVALSRVQVADEEVSGFAGSNNFHGVPYGAFPAADGFVNIGVNRDDAWRRLCGAMGCPELGTDERFASYIGRSKHQAEVHAITSDFTRAHTRAEICEKLTIADIPVASILTMQEVAEDAYMQKRGALCRVDDGVGGSIMLPADPTRVTEPPQAPRVPRLGEHRGDVLSGNLGMSAEDILRLEAAGAFGPPSGDTGAQQRSVRAA